jgi:hypothetical protein
MGAGAAERSAIEAGAPIAMQDALSFQQAGMAGYEGEIKGAIAKQKYGTDIGIIEAQTEGSSILTSQEGQIEAAITQLKSDLESGLSAQEAIQKARQTAYQGAIDAGLSKQEADQAADAAANLARTGMEREQAQQTGANDRLDAELLSRETLDALNISTGERQQVSSLIQATGDTYAEQVRLVQSDPSIPATAKTKIVAELRAQYEQNISNITSIYEIGLEWLTDEETDSGGGDTGGGDGEDNTGGGGVGIDTSPGVGNTDAWGNPLPQPGIPPPDLIESTFNINGKPASPGVIENVKVDDKITDNKGNTYTVIDDGKGRDSAGIVVQGKGRDDVYVLNDLVEWGGGPGNVGITGNPGATSGQR